MKQSLTAILAAAALGLSVSAANAQYGSYNMSNSFGLPRLGGPVVVADYSGYGYGAYGYNGYAAPYTGLNNGFYGSSAYNAGYNVNQNIAFNGNGTTGVGANGVTGGNQLINDPLLGFQQPRTIVDPTTGQVISTSSAAANASAAFNAQLAQFNAQRTALVNSLATGNTTLNTGLTGSANTGFNAGTVNAAALNATAVNSGTINVPANTGTISAGTGLTSSGVVRMPSDGTKVIQAAGSASGFMVPTATSVYLGSQGVTRMPDDGTIVVQGTGYNGNNGYNNGYNAGFNSGFNSGGVVRMPSDGTRVIQSGGFSSFANGMVYPNAYYGTAVNGSYALPSYRTMGNPGLGIRPTIGGAPHIMTGRGR